MSKEAAEFSLCIKGRDGARGITATRRTQRRRRIRRCRMAGKYVYPCVCVWAFCASAIYMFCEHKLSCRRAVCRNPIPFTNCQLLQLVCAYASIYTQVHDINACSLDVTREGGLDVVFCIVCVARCIALRLYWRFMSFSFPCVRTSEIHFEYFAILRLYPAFHTN